MKPNDVTEFLGDQNNQITTVYWHILDHSRKNGAGNRLSQVYTESLKTAIKPMQLISLIEEPQLTSNTIF